MAAVAMKQCKRCGKVWSSISKKWAQVSTEFLNQAKHLKSAYDFQETEESHEGCDALVEETKSA